MAKITKSHPVARYMRSGLSMREAWRRFRGGRKGRRRNMAGRAWSGRRYRPSLGRHRGPRGGKRYRPTLRRRKGHREWLPTAFRTHPVRGKNGRFRRRRRARR